MKSVRFTLSTGETDGELIQENAKTVVVQLADGNAITRHKAKHSVVRANTASGTWESLRIGFRHSTYNTVTEIYA